MVLADLDVLSGMIGKDRDEIRPLGATIFDTEGSKSLVVGTMLASRGSMCSI